MNGKKRGSWSTHELSRLRVLWPKSSEQQVARVLRRSPGSVRRRAEVLFGGTTRRGPWTEEEDRRLREAWGGLATHLLSRMLGRTGKEILVRVEQLRRKKRRGAWTRLEELALKRMFGSRSDDALEVALARPKDQIGRKARALCLQKDKKTVVGALRMPRWDAPAINKLETLYPEHDNLEIARALGRSVASVSNKAHQLGLKKSSEMLAKMGRKNVTLRYS